MREKFENWITEFSDWVAVNEARLVKEYGGNYIDRQTQWAWEAWQAGYNSHQQEHHEHASASFS